MATEKTNSTVPHTFIAAFIVSDTKSGGVDMKKTLARFQSTVESYVKENAELKPTILQELANYQILGESRLVQFTMHALQLPVSAESQERVKSAIKELEQAGRIVYNATENGQRRGRGAGWKLSSAA